jgi:hypothetical protein
MNEKQKKEEFMNEKAQVYYFLEKQDRHLVRLFHWVNDLESFKAEVASSDQDKELENQISEIINRLTMEIGVRITMILP